MGEFLSERKMDQNETNASRRSPWLIVGGFIIIAVIIFAGLFLPPISLGQRLGLGGQEAEPTTAEVSTETEPAASEGVAPQGVALSMSTGDVSVSSEPQSEFFADSSPFPAQMAAVGDVYVFSSADDIAVGQVALPIAPEAGDLKTLDLYGWDGTNWSFMASQIDANSGQIVSAEGQIPEAMAQVQVDAPEQEETGVYANSGDRLPPQILPLLTEVTVGGLTLAANGELNGEVSQFPQGAYDQWLKVTNVGPIIDQSALSSLLSDGPAQEANINNMVNAAAAGGFKGVNLDYQGIPENQAGAFTAFVSSLAAALDGQGLDLAITLAIPTISGAAWETEGQDWQALGKIADVVFVTLPLDPTEYDAGDIAGQMINWATRQIDRSKLSALLDAHAIDRIGETFTTLSNEKALANFGELQFIQGSEEVTTNETVEVALSGSANPLEWDGEGLTYKYSYVKDGEAHDVWLGSEAALSHRLQNALGYNLRGVSVRGLGNIENGEGYAQAYNNYTSAGEAPQPTGAAIVWTVQSDNDSILASESGNELTFSWNVGDSEGNYTVNADFALGDNIARLDSLDIAVKEAVAEEPPAEAAEEPPAAAGQTTTTFTGNGDVVVNVGANVRVGPGLTYGTLSDGAEPGMELDLIGRNSDSTWLNIVMPDGREGWIFSSLVTVNSAINLNSVKIVEVAAPAAVAPSSGGESDGESGETSPPAAAAPPPPVAAAPVTNPGFELGGQSHTFANPQLMSYAGMNWIKFQHKWGPGDDPSAVAGRIQQAHANGFKVLLSIPGQETYPDSIDFNGYVAFLGGVAALGPDAIEVWNEENIDFEWPAGSIDPASYVNNMLAPAYNAIKAANANVMVISGAPAPTGFFGGGCGANGCDDNAYLAGMAAAGAANYLDCVGVHFNAGATPPSQSSGHPAGNDHYSWHFQPTMDLYYSSLGKPVCFTELGYLSGDDYGGVPGRFSWAGSTSVGEHAQWLAEAVSLAANSGKTRLVIIFNVDFTTFGDDPQAGYAMIRADGSCPACETLRQVMGQ